MESKPTELLTESPRTLLLAIVLLAFLCLYYAQFLIGNQVFYWGDHSVFFQPICSYIGEQARSGQFPLWNGLLGCGQSQVAIASPNIFYPTSFLFALLPYSQAVAVQLIVHQLGTAIFAYLFVGRLRWGTTAASVAALLSGLNGYMFGASANFTLLFTVTWLPAFAYFFVASLAAAASSKWKWQIGMVACLVLMLLGGRPEIWSPSLGLIILICAFYAMRKDCSADGRAALLAVACAVAVAMPTILPSIEWLTVSPRNVAALNAPLDFSANWHDFYSMVFGFALGSPYDFQNPFARLFEQRIGFVPFVPSAYFGAVALTLSSLAFFDRRFRWRWALLLITAVLLFLCAGRNSALFPALIRCFPALSVMRYPAKLQILVNLCVAILAARGALFLQVAAKRTKILFACATVWLITAIAMLLLGRFQPLWSANIVELFHELSYGRGSLIVELLCRHAAIVSALCALCFFALGSISLRMPEKYLSAGNAMLVLFVLGSLIFAALSLQTGADPSLYSTQSYAANVITSRDGNVFKRVLTLLPMSAFPIPTDYHLPGKPISYQDLALYQRQCLLENTNLDYGIRSLFAYEGAITREMAIARAQLLLSYSESGGADGVLARVCRTAAATHVIGFLLDGSGRSLPALDPAAFVIAGESKQLNLRVYKLTNPLPRCFARTNWIVKSRDQSLMDVVSPNSDFDPEKSLDVAADSSSPVPTANATGISLKPVVKPIRDEPGMFQAAVNNSSPLMLVLNETFYPGWSATVDRRRVPLYRANGLFQSVYLTPGHHLVTFNYSPPSLYLGLLISLAGLVVTSVIFGRIFRLRTRPRKVID